MKKNEKIRRASKAVLMHKYCEEIRFNLITLKNGHADQIEEGFRAALRSLDKLFRVAKLKLTKTKKFYCVECEIVSQHRIYHYTSRPLGFGGWDQDYIGLKCKNCGHEITENELCWIGLKL